MKIFKHPTAYTFLGFHLLSMIDEGKTLDITETRKRIENNTLFNWLKENFGNGIDMSSFDEEQLDEMVTFFQDHGLILDHKRKLGIHNNGLCLLASYCFEAAQTKITTVSQ